MFFKLGIVALYILFVGSLAAASQEDIGFTFNGFRSKNLSLGGIAQFTSNGILQLTNATQLRVGHAFYPHPINFKNSSNTSTTFSFSTTFAFAIHPQTPTLGGQGIAFVIAPTREIPDALSAQYLGLFNGNNNGNSTNHVVAVELDTIQNTEFEDIDGNHVGIDINGLNSNMSSSAGYYANNGGQFQNLTLISGKAMQVWVEYNGVDKRMNVTLAPINIVSKPNNPLLSLPVDLSSVIEETMYVGFSSSTGAILASHYVLGWSFKINGQAQPLSLSRLPKLPRIGPKETSSFLTIGLPAISIVLVLAAISGAVYYIRRKRKFAEVLEDWEVDYGPHRFKYKDLYIATKGFADKELLGTGGFGSVYRGVLPISNIEIAVKRVSHDSRQGLREFVAEIVSLGRLRHRNLVQLLGYCRRKGELLLVYDYMPNGSLDKFLYDQPVFTLNWNQRFQVIQGVASGLFYLHEEWEQVVVHRDVKASNVLLDGELNARLGDFGLARLYDHGTNPQSTKVGGTLGYIAPELTRTGKATTRTDVYSFGAFLLEVACGKRPIDPRAPLEDLILVDWVFACWSKGDIRQAIDPNLGSDYVAGEVELVMKLGLMCSHPLPMARPRMRQVGQYLKGDLPLPELTNHLWGVSVIIGCDLAMEESLSNMHLEASDSSPKTPLEVSNASKPSPFEFRAIEICLESVCKSSEIGICCSKESWSKSFNGFLSKKMSLGGIAEFTSNGILQLTNASTQQVGHAFYPDPIRFKNSSNSSTTFSFSTTFVFAIRSPDPTLSGHGIAFVIAPTRGIPGARPSQYLGLFNEANHGNSTNHHVAVELDTIQNSEFGDINNNHVGIDTSGLKSDLSHPAGYYANKNGQFLNLTLNSGKAMQVWVEYSGVDKQMNVTLAPVTIVSKPNIPLLSLPLDLSSVIYETMYVGFTSSTGSMKTSHYVLGWSFKINGQAQPLSLSQLPQIPGPKETSRLLTVGLPVISIVLVLAAISGAVYYRRKRKFAEVLEDWELDYGPRRFKYKDLYIATKGFRDRELLGTGGFGSVYRGVLPISKIEIAVKRVSHESRQGMREFVSEIVSIGRLRHRNLVQLLGYCRRKGQLLLVYDYMPNGSLDKFLYNQPVLTLNWDQRFQVIKGVASGLLYLHEEWEQVVVHRDVKASNVLLDGELNGRLGDFGLARLYDHGTYPQTTQVGGTLGYLAPEHTRTGKATTSTDVFAFGAFLLEVACARRPIEPRAQSENLILVDWVFACWSRGDIRQAVDPNLGENYAAGQLELVMKLGLMCSHSEPVARPSMRQVVQYLGGDIPLPELTSLCISATGLTFAHREGFDDVAMCHTFSMEKAFSHTPSVVESLLSGGR
ncbi:hypothetical protein F0562_016291 [Nyssa sinensis]|uniref:non-specific serine/threonine protein kinase n=1 Tax=Nyssa sinensis TaxID=561372 RepID=A0A5J4ZJX5_9ASTE|nr:hypothetical protein F0562_016291 [Nyssa sinensis]